MEQVISNPMEVLTIKNAKYAKECVEVNLSNKQITKIGNFELFPYLEVLVLNNNKLRRIDNLDANFRIKELQVDKNLLTSLGGSIKKFKFINTLYASENNIRNLDKQLKMLSRFAFLEKLNLYGNPCASENKYRLKVIHAIPSLRILDNREIDTDERIKVERYVKSLTAPAQSRSQAKAAAAQKRPRNTQGLSVGEKWLSSEIRKIRAEATEPEEEEKLTFAWDTFKTASMPVATRAQELENQQNIETQVTEWEKSWIRPVFFQYDANKNGYLDMDELRQCIEDLKANRAGVGKIPDAETDIILDIMNTWDKNKDDKISWREFRDGMNQWTWRKADTDVLQSSITENFSKAKWEESNGRMDTAKQFAMTALRLQGLETRTSPIEPPPRERTPPKMRADTMTIGGRTIVL